MVTSRQRTSAAAAQATAVAATDSSVSKVPRPQLEEWTIKEKLCLASLAIKYNNSWNTVARHMQSFAEKERPDGWSNQKTCAAQFDKLMNELGVDKRPKRNEPSDASGAVIYKKMAAKRIEELESTIKEMRKSWLKVCNDLNLLEKGEIVDIKPTLITTPTTTSTTSTANLKTISVTTPSTPTTTTATTASTTTTSTIPTVTPSTPTTTVSITSTDKTGETSIKLRGKPTTSASKVKANTSVGSDVSDKPPTRAVTRRESSRQNLEKSLSTLCKEASEIKAFNQLAKPSADVEKTLGSYDKIVLKHVDLPAIKKRLDGEIDDPYAVMNDFLLIFQNAIMYYPPSHPSYKIAVDLRDKLLPQWERALLDKFKTKH